MAQAKLQANVARAVKAVSEASGLIVCAGAGMGVDSGLPDFRGPEGLWKAYPPLKERGLTLPSISTPHWFDDDPTFAWGFFGHRMNLYNSTAPHPGFEVLRRWGQSKEYGCAVFTSNIDGHFQRAGFPEDLVEECHGSLQYLQCCGTNRYDCSSIRSIWPTEGVCIDVDEATLSAKEPLPRCPGCGGLARPNVLMFNDRTWVETRTCDQSERFDVFVDGLQKSDKPFVVVEIGAGLAVPTVRYQSEIMVRRTKGILIRINPREPEVPNSDTNISLPMGGLDALRAIDELLKKP